MSRKQINLLPKEQLKELRWRAWYFASVRFYIFSIIGVIIVLVAHVFVYVYLNVVGKKLAAETEILRTETSTSDIVELKKKVKDINNLIKDYNLLSADVPKWSVLLSMFSKLVPAGVQIQNFTVDNSKKVVSITGTASTRDAVILLHDNIAGDSDNFSSIDYPLENVSKPRDVTFHFSFKVNDSVLK